MFDFIYALNNRFSYFCEPLCVLKAELFSESIATLFKM